MSAVEGWRCKSCRTVNPKTKYVTIEGVEGLLCPVCMVRYAYSEDTAGKLKCLACSKWSLRESFIVKELDGRGDCEYHCPLCNATDIQFD